MRVVSSVDHLPALAETQSKLLAMPQARIDVVHKFYPGHYIREMRAPAGTIVLGAIHKFATLNICLQGAGQFRNADGSVGEVRAPFTFVSPPGRKAIFVTQDLVWQNVWQTDLIDLEVIEAYLFEKDEEQKRVEFERYELAWESHEKDRQDYRPMLENIGLSAERVTELTVNTNDQVGLPYGDYKFRFGVSPIHGVGTLATADIEEGEMIGIARIGVMRTPLGRYMNHSVAPNAIGRMIGSNIGVFATRRIKGDGSTIGGGEEITIDYRDAVKLSREH